MLIENYLQFLHEEDLTEAARGDVAAALITMSAFVAATTIAAHKIYKYYLSKAARACKGEKLLTSWRKEECIAKYEIIALQKEIESVKSRINGCNKVKHPDMCKIRLNNYIKKKQKKIQKIKNKLGR